MKVKAQFFSKKGFYALPVEFRVRSLAEISGKLVTLLDELPDELEGESLVDWTRVEIQINRE